jgi:hypothetical protein
MLRIQDGTLCLPDGMALTADTVADPTALKGFKDCGEINGFRVLSSPARYLWDRNFSVLLRFEGGKLHFIELLWNDGPLSRLGYDATEKDLLGEKRQLVKMLTKHLGSAPTDTSLGADYFPYPWGLVLARADLKSTMCTVVIDYFFRPR